eukprot:CAMPEP_0175697400 /NCGR_PEP_ID=MMETSP0097-20121207/33440_1 /TAXON_ID=311494 /ORGANISM="Alexandrium monilatum, Strain CCMP3105" /LENGTH=107 /DNA_ID=CAMNT_0017004573 /DNA_START=95 /DNA_END=415 /DNA_ORIENTATION=-
MPSYLSQQSTMHSFAGYTARTWKNRQHLLEVATTQRKQDAMLSMQPSQHFRQLFSSSASFSAAPSPPPPASASAGGISFGGMPAAERRDGGATLGGAPGTSTFGGPS